jgi:hypothetical protein
MTTHKWLRVVMGAAILLILGKIALTLLFTPSHDRTWEAGHEALPHITFNDSEITIDNYRNFTWTGALEATPSYEKRKISLNDISGVDVLISHFSDFEGMAHIFLSFTVASSTPVVVSLETRREVGENFSPFLGILRQFEIIYVVGDERDLVGVRTEYRDERVYLYPTKATPLQAQRLFTLLSTEINKVYESPQMYNTLTRNCTNEITRQVEKMSETDFPLTWKTILPGYFDEVLYEMEIINSTLSFEETKAAHLIDNTAAKPDSSTYSIDIRNTLE